MARNAVRGDGYVFKNVSEIYLRYYNTHTQRMWNVKVKAIPINNRGSWGHLKIIYTIPEQRTRKARNQGTTEKIKHCERCAHTKQSANVKVRKFFMGNNIMCTTNCKHSIAAT